LIGPNRSGKSEILDLYARETYVSSGTILLQGKELPCPYNDSAIKIGFCLPTNALWKGLSVRQHLEIYARIKGIPSSQIKKAATDLIEALGLGDYAGMATKSIKDKGILRKLSVALAVIGAPDSLILDEPTKGLDSAGRKQVWKILKKMKSTIFIATNQIEDAEEKADRIGIMMKGRLVKIDPEEKFFYLNVTGIKTPEIFQQLKENIPEAENEFELVEEDIKEGKLTFKILKKIARANFWKAFRALSDDELDAGEIQDFSFSEKHLSEDVETLARKIDAKIRENNQEGVLNS